MLSRIEKPIFADGKVFSSIARLDDDHGAKFIGIPKAAFADLLNAPLDQLP